MSGRSAYVRKEKTKDKGTPGETEISTIRTNSSNGNDDPAFQRVRKPHPPVIDVSGIEKSNFRTLMDKRSEGVRSGLGKVFGSKKKKEAERSESVLNQRPESHELEAGEFPATTSLPIRSQRHHISEPEYIRSAPSGMLPAVPPEAVFQRWRGYGKPPTAWSKLQKDPELYDPNADTEIYLSRDIDNKPPSMIVSSHVIEGTGSRHLITLLRQGYIDDTENFNGMPPSPATSPDFRNVFPATGGRHRHPSPPTSDGSYAADGRVSYKIFLPPPPGLKSAEAARYQVTTRNVFALLYQVTLVGYDMHQALCDLFERLQLWMPREFEPCFSILEYIRSKAFDDVSYSPTLAAAILGFSEHKDVQDMDLWREGYIHCCGMYAKVTASREYSHISPITRAVMERGALELDLRIHDCELVLSDFDFDNIWSTAKFIVHPDSVGRGAFSRLRMFLIDHYTSRYGTWPPSAKNIEDQWLTRLVTQELALDFAALYDYLVNRQVIWDSSEERAGRKWHLVHPGRRFEADSEDFPFTDMIVNFDNNRKYPHIPHPYPLVPDEFNSGENLHNPNRKGFDEKLEKMMEKKVALAYTEATNIYLLGAKFVPNKLVDAFVRFEKTDRSAINDPYNARRGRWVLIYCILQTLASIAVDTPGLKFTNVDYYLNPKLGPNMPPWNDGKEAFPEAAHTLSHCWTVRQQWPSNQPAGSGRRLQPLLTGLSALSEHGNPSRSGAPSITSSDAGSSLRSPTLTNMSVKSKRSTRNPSIPYDGGSYTGYGQGIEKVDDWHGQEQSRRHYEEKSPKASSREPSRTRKRESSRNRTSHQPQQLMGEFMIKDFDNWPEDDWTNGQM